MFNFRGNMPDSEFVLFENPEYSEYVTTTAGEPYRLFPFGVLVKNGQKRNITPEYARTFKLPHFKPPVKLGSHDERTPAGGHIVGLEVRDDGLYAIPEFTEQGQNSLRNGDYRYHSPEVIWDGGELEDPTTGDLMKGPFIVGDALLHTPHLGEAAALYQYTTFRKEKQMDESEKTLLERFTAAVEKLFTRPETPAAPAPEPEPEPEKPAVIELDKFTAVQAERDEFAAKLQAIEAEKQHAARVEQFAESLRETQVGEGAEMLASMSDEQAAWVLTQFKALSAKVDTSKLYGEIGSDGNGASSNPAEALHAAITARMGEKKVDYNTALAMVRTEQPELIAAAYPMKGGD